MTNTLQFAPLAPLWLLVATGLVGAVMAWRVWRAAGIAPGLLRAAGALALVGVLAGPSRVTGREAPGEAPGLTILLDTSRSMTLCDVPSSAGAIGRLDALRPWLDPDLLRRIEDASPLRLLAFDSRVRPLGSDSDDLDATGDATDLAGALAEAVGSARSGAVVLALTDGADSAGAGLAGAADLALARGVRIDAVAPGSPDAAPDRAVTLRAAEPFLFAGASTELIATVHGRGATRLRIIEQAPGRAERVIDERTVAIDDDVPALVRARVTPPVVRAGAVGTVLYRAAVDAGPGDADPANNEAVAPVQVGDAPIRVLVLEARPSWETRFFLDALRTDPRVAVTSVSVAGGRDRVLVSSPGLVGAPAPVVPPVDAQSLASFDVIALGRGVERWLPGDRAADLVRAVEGGVGVVFLRADPVIDDAIARVTLGAISPVAWGDARLVGGRLFATFEGRAESPVREAVEASGDPYLQYLPEALATSVNEGERTLSAVWLRSEAPGADPAERAPAAIAHQPVGRGQSLAILADGLWRWAFAPPSRDDARRAYRAFWAQSIRVLAGAGDLPPGAELAVTATPARTGEPVRIEVRTRPGSVGETPVTLETFDPDGARATHPLTRALGADRWSASVVLDRPGAWRIIARATAIDGEAGTVVWSAQTDAERAASRARPDAMRDLAEATGGALLDLDRPEALLTRLPGGTTHATVGSTLEPLWRHPALLGLLCALLLSEWALRRLRGGV